MARLKTVLPFLIFAVAVVAIQIITRVTETEYCLTQLTMSLYYTVVVLGLCLVMGFAGQVSLGHGAFFALGAYTTAILTTRDLSAYKAAPWLDQLKQLHVIVVKNDLYGSQIMVVQPWVAFLVALLLTLVVAALIGYPALRLKGHYLAMATLGFGLIVNKIIVGSSFAGAADGITSVPEWQVLPGLTVMGKSPARVSNFYLAGGLLLLLLVLMRNLMQSRVGRALQAIHDRETAANAMGINTQAYKLKIFIVSALLAAVAGVFFTHYTGGISPSEASAFKSVRYVALAAIGGMANPWGVATMSTGINFCSLRGWFGSYDNAVFGAILIIIISIAPEGPLKPLGRWVRKLFQRERRPDGAA